MRKSHKDKAGAKITRRRAGIRLAADQAWRKKAQAWVNNQPELKGLIVGEIIHIPE